MKYLSILLLLGLVGCVTIQGKVDGGMYYAKNGAFELPIPYPSPNLHISDAYESNGELVRFDVEYAYSHRIERFKLGKHQISDININATQEELLRDVENKLFNYFDTIGVKTSEIIHSESSIIKGRQVSISIRKLSTKGETQIRGVLIFIANNYVNTLHFTHPMYQKEDSERILKELLKFYESLAIKIA